MASEEEPKDYYSILGITKNASTCAIRNAYRKLAMKCHPDKCNDGDQAGAKVKFQEIQEAYSVLSHAHKKALFDNGLYNPDDDDEDVEGLSDFISEMSGMIASKDGKGNSFEELQQLFVDTFSSDFNMAAYNDSTSRPTPSMQFDKKRSWGGPEGTYLHDDRGASIVDGWFNSHVTHIFSTKTFEDATIHANVSKKKKKKSNTLERFNSHDTHIFSTNFG